MLWDFQNIHFVYYNYLCYSSCSTSYSITVFDVGYTNGAQEIGISLSQPLPSGDHTANLIAQESDDKEQICFSQPVICEDLLLATQFNLTQSASQAAVINTSYEII